MIKNNIKFLLALLFCHSVSSAFAADLVDIRTGYHWTYSRVVLEFDAPVRYQVFADKSIPTITIDILNDGRILEFADVNIEPVDPFLQRVSYKQNGKLLTVIAYLKTNSFTINQYPLNYPYRIVLDVYAEESELQSAVPMKTDGTKNIKISETIAPALVDSFIVSADSSEKPAFDPLTALPGGNIPQAVLDKTSVLKDSILPQINSGIAEKAESKKKQRGERKARINVFWLLGAAFVLLDSALLVVFLAHREKVKSKTPVPKVKTKLQKRKPVAPPVTARPRPVAVKTARAENDAFLSLLKNAVAKEKLPQQPRKIQVHAAQELVAINKAVKLDTLIGTLSNTVNHQTETPPVPPDFKDIALDLDLVTDDLSEEDAKAQLIGRDGLEFMKNIKRLYLN